MEWVNDHAADGLTCIWFGPLYPFVLLYKPDLIEVSWWSTSSCICLKCIYLSLCSVPFRSVLFRFVSWHNGSQVHHLVTRRPISLTQNSLTPLSPTPYPSPVLEHVRIHHCSFLCLKCWKICTEYYFRLFVLIFFFIWHLRSYWPAQDTLPNPLSITFCILG